MHIFKPLVLVVALRAEIILRLEGGRTDATSQNISKIDIAFAHFPTQQTEVHLHIVVRVEIGASRKVFGAVVADETYLALVVGIFELEARVIDGVVADGDVYLGVRRCDGIFADAKIFRRHLHK